MGLKYFSSFSGIGGFDLALNLLGFEAVGICEIDEKAISTYYNNFSYVKNYGDITRLNTFTLPDFDILVGGFPCQSFSIAGFRKGLEDTRGILFFDLVRILRDKKPEYFLFENVKGLVNHNKGQTFKTMLSILNGLGYKVYADILNSKNFGVPQNRERIYIVGFKNNNKFFEFPKKSSLQKDLKLMDILEKNVDSSFLIKKNNFILNDSSEPNFFTERRTDEAKKIRRETKQKTGKDWCPRREKELVLRKDGIANCLTGGTTKEHLLFDGKNIRKITPRECARLQGFPDTYKIEVSKTHAYKQFGNSVTVNVIYEILKKIIEEDKSCLI